MAWLKKNHSLLLLLNNNLRININDKLPLNHATTDNTYNCNNLKRHSSSSSTRGSGAARPAPPYPAAVGDVDRADRAATGTTGCTFSLKPSPSLSLFSSVTNLFYHHRKAFRRKSGGIDGRRAFAVASPHGQQYRQLLVDTIATALVLVHSIVFVVVAPAVSSMIATATVVLVQLRTNSLASLRS